MLNYELISEWGPIYRDGDKALKVYAPGKPRGYVAEKARVHALVHAAGLPVPAVYGVRKIGARRNALEMAYIKSEPFIYEGMPGEEREKALAVMADLQRRIHAVDAGGFGLPGFSKRIADAIKRTPFLTKQIKGKALDLLLSLDTGKTNLCHGDLHPSNILFDGETHWVIDWDGAAMGEPAADACMTYFYERRFAPRCADLYLQAYCANAGVRREEILAWAPVIAAYQVNIKTKDERDFILKILNEWYEKVCPN